MSDKLRISSRANSVQNIQDEMDWTHVHDAVRGIFGCNIRSKTWSLIATGLWAKCRFNANSNDVSRCHPNLIRRANMIKRFTKPKLLDLLDMQGRSKTRRPLC